MAEYKETKAHEKREHKEQITLRNTVYELKRELKKHEGEPMNKAHPMKKYLFNSDYFGFTQYVFVLFFCGIV
jgi:hypothetical protein